MHFFSRSKASVDARRRQVRPALETLESRIVPSVTDKIIHVYPVGDIVVPIVQGPATSGLQGYGGGLGGPVSLGTFGQKPLFTPPPPSVEQSWLNTLQGDLKSLTTTLAGDIASAGQWVSSTVDSIVAYFSHVQIPPSQLLPPPQLLKVPGPSVNYGGLGGGGSFGPATYGFGDLRGFGGVGAGNFYNQETYLLQLIKQVVDPSGSQGGGAYQSVSTQGVYY
jgi:hypothetical protein